MNGLKVGHCSALEPRVTVTDGRQTGVHAPRDEVECVRFSVRRRVADRVLIELVSRYADVTARYNGGPMAAISDLYTKLFSRGALSGVNDRVLQMCLRARGFNNYRNGTESGEDFFIEKILAPSKPVLCLDVGANMGNYSVKILQKTGAKVIAFEPVPSSYQSLARAVAGFGSRVVTENLGVGSENGRLTIHYNPDALEHASFSEDVKKVSYVTNELTAEVDVLTLDRYCQDNAIESIDLVKIDTEGFESEVFAGARWMFSALRPKFVQMEFNLHQMFRNASLNSFAEQLPDYDLYQLIPGGWMKRNPRDPLSNIYQFSNFVFVRQ